jgi:chaperone required for assembly of F1-ATPase
MKMHYLVNLTKRAFNTRRKRFYKAVNILEVKNDNFDSSIDLSDTDSKVNFLGKSRENFYYITLDNRKCLSAYQDEFQIPSKRLALAIAVEFQMQKEFIDFTYMPLVIIK